MEGVGTIRLNYGIVASILMAVLTLVNGWVFFAVQSTSADLTKLRDTQNESKVITTALAVKMDGVGLAIGDIRADQRQLGEKQTALTINLAETKALTQKAVDNADAAYKEANTVNGKIERLGLQLVGGGKLNPKDTK